MREADCDAQQLGLDPPAVSANLDLPLAGQNRGLGAHFVDMKPGVSQTLMQPPDADDAVFISLT